MQRDRVRRLEPDGDGRTPRAAGHHRQQRQCRLGPFVLDVVMRVRVRRRRRSRPWRHLRSRLLLANVGQFDTGNSTVRATDAGTVYGDLSCYFGYPGEHVYVTLGSHRSDTYTWR